MTKQYKPTFEEFKKFAQGHTVVPIFRKILADGLTPVSAFTKLQGGAWNFLFESVVGGEKVGRYSFLGSSPFLRFIAKGTKVVLERYSKDKKINSEEVETSDPLALLQQYIAKYSAPHVQGLPRFCGGAVGYAGYDTVRYVEKLPNVPKDDRGLPDLAFGFYDHMVIFDHINKTIAVVVHAHLEGKNPKDAYDSACLRIDEIVSLLDAPG
ncbi:MAG: anthranilate synthase component, partial [Planctomycetota bacterium]